MNAPADLTPAAIDEAIADANTCVCCDAIATVWAYGEPFCAECLCVHCDHAHPDTDACPVIEHDEY